MTAALRVIGARPDDDAAGPGPAGLPAPGRAGVGRARPRVSAGRPTAAGQCARHGRARDRLPGPELAVEADSVRVAAAGGQAAIEPRSRRRAGQRLAPFESARLTRGQISSGSALLSGSAILYLAVEGGFATRRSMGSQFDAHPRRHRRLRGPRAAGPATSCPLRGDARPERERSCCRRSICAPPPRALVLGPAGRSFHAGRPAPLAGEPLHHLARLRPHGHAARRAHARAFGQGLQHRLRRHRPGLHPGAGQRPAHRAAGRPADHRRLPQGRNRYLCRPPRLGPHDAGAKIAFAAVDIDNGRGRARRLPPRSRPARAHGPARAQAPIDGTSCWTRT